MQNDSTYCINLLALHSTVEIRIWTFPHIPMRNILEEYANVIRNR